MFLRKLVRSRYFQFLALVPIPVLVCLAAQLGAFRFLEDKLVDWRFLYRGEQVSPAKIVYVDIDSTSLAEIGGWPWDRSHFAQVCDALLKQAKVRAIAIDLVLSDLGTAEIADRAKTIAGNKAFLRLLQEYRGRECPILLAASFSAGEFRDIDDVERERRLPLLVSETRALDAIEAPEGPVFICDQQGTRLEPGASLIDTLRGGTRAVPLFAPTNVRVYQHMSLELARLALGVPRDGVRMFPSGEPLSVLGDASHPLRSTRIDALSLVRADGVEALRIPLRARQNLEVNWHSSWWSPLNQRDSFSRVAAHAEMLSSGKPEERAKAKEYFQQEEFKDALVLIGPVDTLLQDRGPSPFDEEPVPRVGVHGNLVKTLLSGAFLKHLSDEGGILWAEHGLVLLLSGLITSLAMRGGSNSLAFKLSAVLLGTLYVYVAFEAFRLFNLVLPIVAPVTAGFLGSFAMLVWQSIEEERQKSRIRGMFGTYLSPTVVEELIESGRQPELGGHDAEITAYFSDIQGFSAFAEHMESSQVGELLNEVLSVCTEIVQEQGGTLDKYIGDALVAMFGAPVPAQDHAYRACRSALNAQLALERLRERWKGEGDRWPVLVHGLRMRIGLNTGISMIGNMGSRTRFNYTMMGDNVNLAARMESGAKSWGVYTLCSESTRSACERYSVGTILFRPLGRIVVQGRSQPVPIHELVGFRDEAAASTLECLDVYARGLERLYLRDWSGAKALFERSAQLEPLQPSLHAGVRTNASLARLEKLARYMVNEPPADWDGVEIMTEK